MGIESHEGSARNAGYVRRYRKECYEALPFRLALKAIYEEVTIVQPSEEERRKLFNSHDPEENPPEVKLAHLIGSDAERFKGVSIRRGGKFASIKNVAEEIAYYAGEIKDHEETQRDIRRKMNRLLGGAVTDKVLAKVDAESRQN